MRHLLPLWLTLALVAALTALSAAGGARPAGERTGLIAFTRADGLYVMHADGTGAHRIMRARPAVPYGGGAAWSPDGSRLVYADSDGIWLMDASGRNRVQVATGGEPYWIGEKPNRQLFYPRTTNFGSPTWSPDGRRIAFTAFEGAQNRDIFVMNADGSNPHRLRKTPYFEGGVDWSPAGGWLVFDSGSWFSDVFVIRTDGTGLRNLTPGGGWIGSGQPAWSPDGRRIAFGQAGRIWLMDARGRSRTQLTSKPEDGSPDWSPDGRKIVFVRSLKPRAFKSTEIYLMKTDGTGATRLTHNGVADGSPAWQPVAVS